MNRPRKQTIINKYLEKFSHSEQSQNMRRSSLNYFFQEKYFNYPDHIFDISTANLLDYFNWLKKRSISLTTKKNKWNILVSFLKYTEQYYNSIDHNVRFVIPDKLIDWNGNHTQPKSNKKVLITPGEIEHLLGYFKRVNFNHYIIFRLFAETGIRKGELLNAKINELNLEDRYLNIHSGKTGEKYYFFSKGFAKWLKIYINKRNKLDTPYDNLFLSNRNGLYSRRAFNLILQYALNKLDIKKKITCHTFRRSINTYRKKVCNTKLEDRERLLGHKTNNVNVGSYTILDIQEHQSIYDSNFPYSNIQL